MHRLWEARHAELMLPVAEQHRRGPQIFTLRAIEARLIHRRALIRFIREHGMVGEWRKQLLAVFHGPMDMTKAILVGHRQYTLATSSRVATDRLIDVMRDSLSVKLLEKHDPIYSKYFEHYCFVVSYKDASLVNAMKLEMRELRKRAKQVIEPFRSERPDGGSASFDRRALLARSGRYPALNYMAG